MSSVILTVIVYLAGAWQPLLMQEFDTMEDCLTQSYAIDEHFAPQMHKGEAYALTCTRAKGV